MSANGSRRARSCGVRPAWVEGRATDSSGKPWRERAFVPLIGFAAAFNHTPTGTPDPWLVELLVDAEPPLRRSHLAAYPASLQWGSMLAFLGRRDFPAAEAALRTLDLPLRDAIFNKVENPLAAICAALIALATHQTEALNIPEQWLDNLCNWVPTLPTAPSFWPATR